MFGWYDELFLYIRIQNNFFNKSFKLLYMKKLLSYSLLVCALLFAAATANAQFKNGKSMIGPHIGLSQYGGAISLGGMFEAPVTKPNEAGPGIIGVSGQLHYYTYDWAPGYGVTWIIIGVYGNYHFVLDNRDLDPFIGLGLNYGNVSATGGYSYGSGVYFGIQGGIRYFFSPNVAGRLVVGNAASFLTLGVDFGI